MRFFNTAGPVKPELHYCLPPLQRFDLAEVLLLIDQQKYFVLHAPRQVGKTSYLLALMDYLNGVGNYRALYFNVEVAQTAREDVARGMVAILSMLSSMARTRLHDTFPESIRQAVLANHGGDAALFELLTQWAQASDKPLVLLIDEIDALVGDTLISVLRQLRAGYANRPVNFPQSIILCGVRDVRDYRIHSDREKTVITGGSAFNVKAESLRLGDFDRAEMELLYHQHTKETGQVFKADTLELMWELTRGQPWLVNALGYEVCFKMKEGRDRTQPITADMVAKAKENLILRRETHLDQLTDKLKEPRVHRVIAPILAGDGEPEKLPADDVQYVADLGLITTKGQIRIANKIYQEVIPRELIYTTQLTITHQPEWYIAGDGRLDIPKLLAAFQQFFREHSASWLQQFDYQEAGPQLLLQAFLQRIVNGSGQITREYGLGRDRTDLLVLWSQGDIQTQRVVIETKLRRGKVVTTIKKGGEQTWRYMDSSAADEGHLVIFDRDQAKPWSEKVFTRTESFQGRIIQVWGM
ncbi:MAG: ATP-binding protein [Caldilinea sp. CFX5]|nr:ATP-binding protein [Caldilinea sp. CFX5]